ncbi:MAG: hypothetical protein SangKO_074680 [Sandaracinaceae bacterium]
MYGVQSRDRATLDAMRFASVWCAVLWVGCVAPTSDRDDASDVGARAEALFTGSGAVAAEATIYENATGNNGGSYSEICVGNLGSTGSTRRAFVRYSLPSIPSSAIITRVRLSLTQDLVRLMGAGAPKSATLQLQRVTGSWSEGAGGGFTRSCGGGADVAGVDWAGAPSVSGTTSSTEPLSNVAGAAITIDTDVGTNDDQLIADVQAWVSGSATNNGWRLTIAEEGTVDNARSITPGALSVEWLLPNGDSCTADADCNSGHCVGTDGLDCGGGAGCVCCNAATCDDDCESCHLAGSVGTCSPRSSATICRSASCSAGTATLETTCNGASHTCPSASTVSCSPYFCSGTACGSSCASNADCEATFFCNGMNECEAVSNECVAGLDDCVALATCADPTVALGDWTCTCPAGYAGDGRSPGTGCSDVNECAAGTDDCDVNATCTNTVGSFTCACNGPEWVGDGRTCVDYDECMDPFYTAMCDANASCVNQVPGFSCVCQSGYRGDGFTCAEIDECMEGSDDCHADASCTNTPGSFTCACNGGYSGDGRSCADIDECMDPTFTGRCSTASTCFNLPGTAECRCNTGYRGDGMTCDDIDECMEGSDTCDENATCSNTNGSYTCACDEHWAGSGFVCSDVDECARGVGGCGANEECINNRGAPNDCVCRPGFSRAEPDGPCLASCGDGVRGPGEECDDGNMEAGDGCDARCDIEDGWACFEPMGTLSTCENTCGDGLVDRAEECDDGEANSNTAPDGCRTNCRRASCGDGVTDTGEECDDGDGNDDDAADACRTACLLPYCGDGVVDMGERCDPGGGVPGAAVVGTCTSMCAGDAGVDPEDPPTLTGGACSCRATSGGGQRWPRLLLPALGVLALRRRRR